MVLLGEEAGGMAAKLAGMLDVLLETVRCPICRIDALMVIDRM